MEPEDEDNSNPSTDPTLDTNKPAEPVSDAKQEAEVGEGGNVAQSEQPVLPVDNKEEVEEGSERVEAVQEVDEGIETENRNADVAEEELRVAGQVESVETRSVGGEVADVAGELENKGTEAKEEETGVAEELGDARTEELVKEERGNDGNDGAAAELENMGQKEEAVEGVEMDEKREIEPEGNLEVVDNGGEELSLGQKEEATEEREESDVHVVEDTKMVAELDDTEEMKEENVASREGLEHSEGAEDAEEAKLIEKTEETDAAQDSADGVNEKDEMGDAEMADMEGERDNEEEMESAEVGEEKEEAEEDEKMKEVEEAEMAEEGAEEEEISRSVGGKRKRGKNAKSPAKPPVKKKAEEDVCFICFDGGNLVLCDRRGCPKAYHPSCVNRDEAFFQTKGRWNCGLIQMKAELAGVEFMKG